MVTYVEVAPAAKAQAATLLGVATASKQDAGLLLRGAPGAHPVQPVRDYRGEGRALNAHAATAHAASATRCSRI
jgi:hypothetical protein